MVEHLSGLRTLLLVGITLGAYILLLDANLLNDIAVESDSAVVTSRRLELVECGRQVNRLTGRRCQYTRHGHHKRCTRCFRPRMAGRV